MTTATWADVVRTQCQTEESRGQRFTSIAMYKAADDSDPWRGCMGGCQMASSIADAGRAMVERFKAEGRAALLKARALEAAHCPDIAEAIIDNGPATAEEKAPIIAAFEAEMQKEYARIHTLRVWQREHPQCEHVEWYGIGSWAATGNQSGTTPGSSEDLSGNFKGKKGQCSAAASGEMWRGTKDDMTMWDPATNDLIAKVRCANALRKFGFGEGSYADPKICSR
jgi:hypothetical protein